MSTTWTKNAKESFSIGDAVSSGSAALDGINQNPNNTHPPGVAALGGMNQNPNGIDTSKSNTRVADYGGGDFVGKDVNELILNKDISLDDISREKIPIDEETIKSFLPADTLSQLSSLSSLLEFFKKFDKNKLKELYESIIIGIKNGINGVKGNVAEKIASWFHDEFKSPAAKKDIKILSDQFALWVALIPMSYLMVINWWYVMAYTNFTMDFRDYIWEPMSWCMSPAFYALEKMNYEMLSIRMDANAKFPFVTNSVEFMRSLWHWRPVVFSLFHLSSVLMLLAIPVTDVATSIMINGGFVATLMTLLGIYYYATLYFKERWYERFITAGTIWGFLGLVLMSIGTFLCMLGFMIILPPIFLLYIMFFSYMVIVVFNGFWPPAIWSIYNQIFDDLREAPVGDPNPESKWGKMKNLAFQQFHGLYLLAMVIGIVVFNVNQAFTFSSQSLIAFAIMANLFIFAFCTPSAFIALKDLINIWIDTSGDKKGVVSPTETPISPSK